MDNKKITNTKLSTSAYLMIGWPLCLLLIGGAIGGGLGGIAYMMNLKIYKSNLSNLRKISLNIICGISAFAIWWIVVQWLRKSFE